MTDRARLTLTTIVQLGVALAALAALWPAFSSVFSDTAPQLDPGVELLFSTMLPLMILVLLGVLYLDSRRGTA